MYCTNQLSKCTKHIKTTNSKCRLSELTPTGLKWTLSLSAGCKIKHPQSLEYRRGINLPTLKSISENHSSPTTNKQIKYLK